jgi:GT2 family glycosyltransferase
VLRRLVNGPRAVPVTAIITAFRDVAKTLTTIRRIKECRPCADEVLVHVDGNSVDCVAAIREAFPDVEIIFSSNNIGPGGGRNKLILAARNELIASFDDDSYPLDAEYFAQVVEIFSLFPSAMIVAANLFHPNDPIVAAAKVAYWSADFCGGAAVYRKSAFAACDGYVPIATAYGMEESDLALRFHASQLRILSTQFLRVYHDNDRSRHASAKVTGASIVNVCLLAYLRYPWFLWPIGFSQCVRRVIWCVRNGRREGLWSGVKAVPRAIRDNRKHRKLVSARHVISYLRLRHSAVRALVTWPTEDCFLSNGF